MAQTNQQADKNSSATGQEPTTTRNLDSPIYRLLNKLGSPVIKGLAYVGSLFLLGVAMTKWVWRSLVLRKVRFGRFALYAQMVRVGVRSIAVIALVNACIGFILALQMAPPLQEFGQVERVANIIAVAVTRELGPLISAIVMTGFAGAAIAAELGTMVVGEEIEALKAHALNPVRFLVVPRVIATTVSLVFLCIMAEIVALSAGWVIGVTALDIPSGTYINDTIEQLKVSDILTGLWKAGFFGVLISLIACHAGLSVTGGAAGVGKATTTTVVLSIVYIIIFDLIFTGVFYQLGWA